MTNKLLDLQFMGAAMQGLANLDMIVENNGLGNPLYVGYFKPGAATSDPSFRIKKYSYDGNGYVILVETALNNSNLIHVWDDRATYF